MALVTLNRPARLNAISPGLGAAFDACILRLAQDVKVRVIVITGAGRGFCAGADAARLTSLAEGQASLSVDAANPYKALSDAPAHLRQRYLAPAAVPQPVIAAVNGVCVGAGLSLAVACDVRIAGADASFSAMFSRRGLVAEAGLAWSLPRLVGVSAARDMLLSGRRIDADLALRFGLVSQVTPADSLLDTALAYARDIATQVSPRSARLIKAQLRDAETQTYAAAIEAANQATRAALATADFREGLAAMLEKRPPAFPDP